MDPMGMFEFEGKNLDKKELDGEKSSKSPKFFSQLFSWSCIDIYIYITLTSEYCHKYLQHIYIYTPEN